MRRWFGRAAFVVLTLPLLYLGCGLLGGLWLVSGQQDGAARPYQIGLIAGPIHYDLLIPLRGQTRAGFAFAKQAGVPIDDPAARWLLLGRGARGFYTSTAALSDMKAATVLQAATGDTAVMRVDAVGAIRDFTHIPRIALTEAELTRLVNAILASFDTQTTLPLKGFTATDAIFPARGRFNLFATCNVWVGQVLRAAGLPIGRWTPFPQSIRLYLAQANLTIPASGAIDR